MVLDARSPFLGIAMCVATTACGAGESGNGAVDAPAVEWPMSYATIAATDDDEVEWAIVQRVGEVMGADYRPRLLLELPVGVRTVYATWEVEAEVNNGGFEQYFLNTDGVLADEAVAGFQRIGATRAAALLELARQNRDDPDQLAALDDRFYTLDEPIQDLRIRYIRTHPQDFQPARGGRSP